MALHNLKITVVDGGRGGGGVLDRDDDSSGGEKKPDGKKSLLYKVLNYNQTIKGKIKQSVSPTTFFAIQQGINLATQTGRQAIDYFVSDIGRTSGDNNYQALVQRKIEVVTDALSVGQGALAGAGSGAAFGPMGAAIGAVVGVISSGLSLGFKYAKRDREYQHEMFKENTSQAYRLARANYSIYNGRAR